ncbi:MAG: phosphatidylserine decarboxylase [Clostridia bacterium]|nr:phosphatidylserine decarboxylase [Clostridia bacterium]
MVKDRSGATVAENNAGQERFLTFLYNKPFGKVILAVLKRRFISKLGRLYMSSPLSKPRIKKLISQCGIDMSEYEEQKYRSFNEFFIRKILPGKRVIDEDPSSAVSPADSKLTVYGITEDGVYNIKDCGYTAAALLGDIDEAKRFYGGDMFVYRLSVDNYHRYSYIDGGTEEYHRFIPGVLHTVNPVALEKYDVYGKNCREVTYLNTDNFGRVAFVEIGAMMVGKINNAHPEGRFEKGSEKGYFSFGGSTIAVLYEKGAIIPDPDIAENSKENTETLVRLGEKVGTKAK